ncbi:uncharacterized protein il17rc [Tachysurus fulvidraco]|uniref:uncharacterized protein il17rc n=1 Tax=Tachysurus fulvidraco TaxID=1234273 RepID=UPI000F4E2680|nr:uncharacterized protein il17rc [Tachysurus fulvidraco]
MSTPWRRLFFMLVGAVVCAADLEKYDSQGDITCSQGLKQCTIDNMDRVLPPCDGALPFCTSTLVDVLALGVQPALCTKATMMYKACLRIRIQLKVLATDNDDVSGETQEDLENEDPAAITLCYVSAPNLKSCKEIKFFVKSSTQNHQEESVEVEVKEGVFLGSTVNVSVHSKHQVVQFPRVDSVCPSPHIEECKNPIIYPEIDEERGVMELKAELDDRKELHLCVKRKGMPLCRTSDWTIPLHAVTHCMCFQAWRKNTEDKISSRSEMCPFEKDKGFRRNVVKNVSLSVGHSETNEGRPALNWNVSAPCKLEVEVWPCQMAMHVGGGCREVLGFRQNISTGWDENISTLWTSGAFLDVRTTNHLLPCVMFKLDGEAFGPVCDHYTSRGRWICVVLLLLLLVVLLSAGVCALRIRHREWLSNSNPAYQSQGRLGDVLLVHSSGSDSSFSDTVCWFATWLSELGFSVSLDLWNQAVVSKLGPTPWLHSRLQHVQKSGGKTLVLLSHDAVHRAEAHSESWSCVSNKEDGKTSKTSWMWNADVFSSALSSIFSARLQGCAVEHFALVQLESGALELPELFQGLKLYQLPSESQRLLTDLQTRSLGSFGARLKRFLWTWRASARLEKRLRDCGKEQQTPTESMLTHVKSLSVEKDTEEETLPLNSYLPHRAGTNVTVRS